MVTTGAGAWQPCSRVCPHRCPRRSPRGECAPHVRDVTHRSQMSTPTLGLAQTLSQICIYHHRTQRLVCACQCGLCVHVCLTYQNVCCYSVCVSVYVPAHLCVLWVQVCVSVLENVCYYSIACMCGLCLHVCVCLAACVQKFNFIV